MSFKAKTMCSWLLAAGLLLLAQPAAHAQGNPPGVNPTHYWTYKLIDPVPGPQPIALSDQFFPAFIPATVDTLDRLVNWVTKIDPATGIVSAPVDTFLHYTWWHLVEKYPVNQSVQVTNQFGSYAVQVFNTEFLLVPALKNQPAGQQPPPANHYLCYRASGFPPPTHPYVFQDEWRQDQLPVGPLEFLCTPCAKQHQGRLFPPVDTLTHLALYPILPQSPVFFPLILDQFIFIQRPVQQTPTEYLMVPSLKKLIVTPTNSSSWGKLKTLYR